MSLIALDEKQVNEIIDSLQFLQTHILNELNENGLLKDLSNLVNTLNEIYNDNINFVDKGNEIITKINTIARNIDDALINDEDLFKEHKEEIKSLTSKLSLKLIDHLKDIETNKVDMASELLTIFNDGVQDIKNELARSKQEVNSSSKNLIKKIELKLVEFNRNIEFLQGINKKMIITSFFLGLITASGFAYAYVQLELMQVKNKILPLGNYTLKKVNDSVWYGITHKTKGTNIQVFDEDGIQKIFIGIKKEDLK